MFDTQPKRIFNNQPKATNRSGDGERGQTTAEFIVVAAVMLLFFFLIVDFGWLLKNWIVVTNAAREGTRCEVAQSCPDDDVQKLIKDRIEAGITQNLTGLTYDIEYVDKNGDSNITDGDSIVVCVKADNQYIAPTFQFMTAMVTGSFKASMPLRAREEMRLEYPPPATLAWPKGDGVCDFS